MLTGVRPVKLYHCYLEQGEPRNRIAELLEEWFLIAPSGKISRYANPREPRHYNRHYREYIEGKLKHLDEQLFAFV